MRDINTVPVEDLTNEELIARARHLDKMLGNDVDDTILELTIRLDTATKLLQSTLPYVNWQISNDGQQLKDYINRFLK